MQILILRKNYKWIQFLRLPVAIVFGYLTDFGIWAIQGITVSSYRQQWMLCFLGILLVGIGVSFEVTANVVTLAGEGLILAICQVTPVKFGTMKIIFDVSLVIIAASLSFLFLGGLMGIREGTIAAALLVGLISRQINRPLHMFEQRFLTAKKDKLSAVHSCH